MLLKTFSGEEARKEIRRKKIASFKRTKTSFNTLKNCVIRRSDSTINTVSPSSYVMASYTKQQLLLTNELNKMM